MIVEVEDVVRVFKPITVKITIETPEEFDALFNLSVLDLSIPEAVAENCPETSEESVRALLQGLHKILLPGSEWANEDN